MHSSDCCQIDVVCLSRPDFSQGMRCVSFATQWINHLLYRAPSLEGLVRESRRRRSLLSAYWHRTDRRGVDLISDALPFGPVVVRGRERGSRLREAKQRSHGAVIRVFNEAGNVIRNAQTRWRFQRTMSVSRDEAQSSI
jgi:hypothetical protein